MVVFYFLFHIVLSLSSLRLSTNNNNVPTRKRGGGKKKEEKYLLPAGIEPATL